MRERLESYYRVLNLPPTASPQEIDRAHRDLADVWHPDRFADNTRLRRLAEERLKEINRAYDALKRAPASAQPPSPGQPLRTDPQPSTVPSDARRRPAYVWYMRRRGLTLPYRAMPVFAALIAVILVLAAAKLGYTLLAPPSQELGGLLANGRMGPIPGSNPEYAAEELGSKLAGLAREALPVEVPVPSHGSEAPQRQQRTRTRLHPGPALRTGSDLIAPHGRDGVGSFEITNRTAADVIARLTSATAPDDSLRLIYIRAGTEVVLDKIGPGTYLLSFSTGPLSAKTLSFSANAGPFEFVQVQSVAGHTSDHYRLVLKTPPAR